MKTLAKLATDLPGLTDAAFDRIHAQTASEAVNDLCATCAEYDGNVTWDDVLSVFDAEFERRYDSGGPWASPEELKAIVEQKSGNN